MSAEDKTETAGRLPVAGPAGDPGRVPSAEGLRRARRRHRYRPRWWAGPLELAAGFLFVTIAVIFVLLAVTGRPLPAPALLVAEIEARANAGLAGQARVELGGLEVILDQNFVPRVRLTGVRLIAPSGGVIAEVPDLRATLHPAALMRGRIEPRSLQMTGAAIALRRLPDGRFDIPGASLASGSARPLSVPEMLDAIDQAFAVPILAGIDRIDVSDLTVSLDDARTGKHWQAQKGKLTLDQTDSSILMAVGLTMTGQGQERGSGEEPVQGRAEIDFASRKNSPEARIEARIADVPSAILAAQSPALAWLSAVDSPISGSVRTGADGTGAILPLAATLTLGAGALRPGQGARPLPFRSGRVGLTYDPATALLTLTDLSFDSRALTLAADGKAWLKGAGTGLPDALVGQIRITDLKADPDGLFAEPVVFSQGAADIKIELKPFRLQIGQLALVDQGRRISLKGSAGAAAEGWNVSVDVAIDAIESARLLALWPVSLVPKTREWLQENVATAELSDLKAAIRLKPGAEPVLSLGYEFRAADVRFLRTLPPIRDGQGYATVDDYAYTLVLDRGHVTAPQGGDVDVAGSVLRVPDIRVKPAPARVTLRTDSSVTAALSLLDQPPFQFVTRAGRPVDIAEGRAVVESVLDFPMVPKVRTEDLDFLVTGTLTDVRSDRIVPGRVLAADRLEVRATPSGMEIEGPGTLSDVPFRAAWRQPFGPEAKGRSRVEGTVELSPRFIDTFRIGLPKGSVRGTGRGAIMLDVAKDAPVKFTLSSDLKGLALAIPGIGWSKAADRAGRLEAAGNLGTPPVVDSLTLEAAGLRAHGTVTVRPDGTLGTASFDTAELAGQFKGALDLKGRGKGQLPQLVLRGGTADIRQTDFGSGGGNLPLDVSLDRLTISDGIALTGFRGDFTTGGGFSGQFRGLVNGDAAVTGTAAPQPGGTGFRILSADAGSVFRAAGMFSRGRGGSMDLTLLPGGSRRTYDGTVRIKDIRVVDAPVLAELLGLISVVGLLEQLNGTGILFSDAEGDFNLTPDNVTIRNASAVGASLGVSAEGGYGLISKQMDLRGVISPIYLLNGIGRIFNSQREGLFGFSYRLSGPASDPQVAVNPFSILTPGMFRNLFRSDPPEVKQ